MFAINKKQLSTENFKKYLDEYFQPSYFVDNATLTDATLTDIDFIATDTTVKTLQDARKNDEISKLLAGTSSRGKTSDSIGTSSRGGTSSRRGTSSRGGTSNRGRTSDRREIYNKVKIPNNRVKIPNNRVKFPNSRVKIPNRGGTSDSRRGTSRTDEKKFCSSKIDWDNFEKMNALADYLRKSNDESAPYIVKKILELQENINLYEESNSSDVKAAHNIRLHKHNITSTLNTYINSELTKERLKGNTQLREWQDNKVQEIRGLIYKEQYK